MLPTLFSWYKCWKFLSASSKAPFEANKNKSSVNPKSEKEKLKEVVLLGERIKSLRKAKGYSSQETFAYDNDYTLSYYSRLERGEDIRFSSLLKVIKALDITLEEFFSEGFDWELDYTH